MARLILDSGAMIALARRDARVRAFVDRAIANRDLVLVPAVVIAETTRGGPRDAPVNQVLKAVSEVVPVTEQTARKAGALLGRSGLTQDTVDALVAAEALRSVPAVLLTSDTRDMTRLIGGEPGVAIYRV